MARFLKLNWVVGLLMFGGVYVLHINSSRRDSGDKWGTENKYAFRRINGYFPLKFFLWYVLEENSTMMLGWYI